MQCPNCDCSLRTIVYESVQIETCDSCHGEWLDASELGKVADVREQKFDADEKRAIAAATKITGVRPADHDRDLKCPKCSGVTDAINYGADTGILIDRCPNCHGVWLDADELENIQMLVEQWEDGLPEDLKQYGGRLRQIAVDVEESTRFKGASIPFFNTIVNGILDWMD